MRYRNLKLKVLAYDVNKNFHLCEHEDGDEIRVYLCIDGNPEGETAESIVGKVVTCERVFPYLFIGSGVSVVEEGQEISDERAAHEALREAISAAALREALSAAAQLRQPAYRQSFVTDEKKARRSGP